MIATAASSATNTYRRLLDARPPLAPAAGMSPELGPSADQAAVHAVGLGPEMVGRLSGLCPQVGLAVRAHADSSHYAKAVQPEDTGCVLVHVTPLMIGGLELLIDSRRGGTSLPVIVMADWAEPRTVVRAIKAGASDFLALPVADDDLLRAIGVAVRLDGERRQAAADRAALHDRFASLSAREREVMMLVTEGRLNKQVAGDLGLSEVTVKAHRGSAMRKMGARSLADLVRMADALLASTPPFRSWR